MGGHIIFEERKASDQDCDCQQGDGYTGMGFHAVLAWELGRGV